MELRLINILLILTFALKVNANNLGYSDSKPLVLGIDQDYPPLEYVDEKDSDEANEHPVQVCT